MRSPRGLRARAVDHPAPPDGGNGAVGQGVKPSVQRVHVVGVDGEDAAEIGLRRGILSRRSHSNARA